MHRPRLLGILACTLAVGAVAWLVIEGGLLGEAGLQHDERVVHDAGPEASMAVDAAGKTIEDAPALEGREAPMPDPSAGRGSVEVLVLGAGKQPLPGVVLEAVATGGGVLARLDDVTGGTDDAAAPAKSEAGVALPPTPTATTDARGKAFFPDLPYDGTITVGTRTQHASVRLPHLAEGVRGSFVIISEEGGSSRTITTFASGASGSVAIRGPEARIEIGRGLPLRLVEQAASTGATLELAPWAVTPYVGQAGRRELRPLPMIAAHVAHGAQNRLGVALSERAGFVRETGIDLNAYVSPLARELIAFVPQRPEAEVMLTVPEGVPLRAGADWGVRYKVDGRSHGKASAHLDGFGRVTVRGVPFLPGQQVWLGGKVKGYGHLSALGRFGTDAREPLALEGIWKPAAPSRVAEARAAEHAAKLEAMRAKLELSLAQVEREVDETSKDLLTLEVVQDAKGRLRLIDARGGGEKILRGRIESEDKHLGKVRLLVRRPDGTPAAGAWARVGKSKATLSAQGTARFDALEPGTHQVQVMGAGATFTAQVVVTAGETTPLELDAPVGGAVHVEVVDAEGRGLPFARVYVEQESGLAHADLEGDVQRVDPFTDHRGRRTFRGVEAGEVEITAVYGARKASVKVPLGDRMAAPARIVLPVPAPQPKTKAQPPKDGEGAPSDRLRLEKAMDEIRKAKEKLRWLEEERAREDVGK